MSEAIALTALDGSNPLAFLAALGTLRLLQLDTPGTSISMRWVRQAVWVPELQGINQTREALCERLHRTAKEQLPVETFLEFLKEQMKVDNRTFASFVNTAYAGATRGTRIIADFASAFGSEVCKRNKTEMERTDLCFTTGSGKQYFIGTMARLKKSVTVTHIQDALFGEWKKDRKLSMRWDPGDVAEYAYQWKAPTDEGSSSVWGANWLAVQSLPLFPSFPTENGLRTTGFRQVGRGAERDFSWPIWAHSVGLDTVRSLLSMRELQSAENELDHRRLRTFGIEEVYRAPRVRVGQGKNFKLSFRPARAI